MKYKTGAALLLVAVFLLGGITGGVTHNLYRDHVKAAGPRQPIRRDGAEEFAQALNLDAKQKETLEAIFKQGREHYRALSQQFRPQYEALRNETHEQIRQILREDQKVRFEEFLKEMNKRRRERMPQTSQMR